MQDKMQIGSCLEVLCVGTESALAPVDTANAVGTWVDADAQTGNVPSKV